MIVIQKPTIYLLYEQYEWRHFYDVNLYGLEFYIQ